MTRAQAGRVTSCLCFLFNFPCLHRLGSEGLLWEEQCPITLPSRGWGMSMSTHPARGARVLLQGQEAAGGCPGSWCSAPSPPQQQASGVYVRADTSDCLLHASVPPFPGSEKAGSRCLELEPNKWRAGFALLHGSSPELAEAA